MHKILPFEQKNIDFFLETQHFFVNWHSQNSKTQSLLIFLRKFEHPFFVDLRLKSISLNPLTIKN